MWWQAAEMELDTKGGAGNGNELEAYEEWLRAGRRWWFTLFQLDQARNLTATFSDQ